MFVYVVVLSHNITDANSFLSTPLIYSRSLYSVYFFRNRFFGVGFLLLFDCKLSFFALSFRLQPL